MGGFFAQIIIMKIGETFFKNTDFIYYGIRKGKVKLETEASFVRAHPPELGKMLIKGDVDIAPASSIIYAKHFRQLYILPDFSISAKGETGSILIFSEASEIEELSGKTIATPATSASSVALLEIILKEKGIDAEIVRGVEPDLEKMLSHYEAALLIGDDALKEAYNKPELLLLDLGTAWYELTGKKMVYALWLLNSPEAGKIYNALNESRRYAKKNFDRVVEDLAEKASLPQEYLSAHLRKLEFNLNEDALDGLEEYFILAEKHGIINEIPDLRFTEVL